MKQTLVISIFVLLTAIGRAQLQTPLSLISAAGGTGQATMGGSTRTVEWTIGEVFIGGGGAGSLNVTIGQQQSWADSVSGIQENVFTNVRVYPNPASSYVRIENMPDGNKTITLTDIAGKLLQSINTPDNSKVISVSNLPTGVYTLTLDKETNSHTTFKIIISNN